MYTCTCCNTTFNVPSDMELESVFPEFDLEDNFFLCETCFDYLYYDIDILYLNQKDEYYEYNVEHDYPYDNDLYAYLEYA